MAEMGRQRMPSPEGEGKARDAWDDAWGTYYRANKKVNQAVYSAIPGFKDLVTKLTKGNTGAKVLDAFGFWVWWRIAGGFENTQKMLGLSRSGMYRRIALFREVFGEHPDVFEMPGITVDPVEFVRGMEEWRKSREAD